MWEKLKKQSGIYCIYNTKTRKRYIGSAKNLRQRVQYHKQCLEKQKHHSILLQRAWNKYGPDAFKVKVLELVPVLKNLIKREQFYLDKFLSYDSKKGYNIEIKAGSSLGLKRSQEFKDKCRRAKLGTKQSQKTKDLRSSQMMGKNNHWYGEHPTKKMLKKMRVPKKITDPFVCVENGKIYRNTGDAERELKAKSSNIIKCLRKERKSIHNYRFIYLKDIPKVEIKKIFKHTIRFKDIYSIYKIIYGKLILQKETGKIFLTIDEAAKFNAIQTSSLYPVIYGTRNSIYGMTFERI